MKHIDFTYPFDQGLSQALIRAARRSGHGVVEGGVYATTQGPRLESAAEVRRFQRDGANVIGMTLYPAGLRESHRKIEFESLKEIVDRGVRAAVDVVREALRANASE